jgi:hypothetical protein
MNFGNKWTSWAGIVIGAGSILSAIGNLMTGDVSMVGSIQEHWMGIVAAIGLLKASDGGL